MILPINQQLFFTIEQFSRIMDAESYIILELIALSQIRTRYINNRVLIPVISVQEAEEIQHLIELYRQFMIIDSCDESR